MPKEMHTSLVCNYKYVYIDYRVSIVISPSRALTPLLNNCTLLVECELWGKCKALKAVETKYQVRGPQCQ